MVRAAWRRPAGCEALAIVPVQEEQGEGAHDQEEEDPHTEASVVLNGLETQRETLNTIHILYNS